MTEYYTPEESQLLVELAIVLAGFAGTQLLEEDFPVIGEPSYLQDKYLRQAQAVLKVVQKHKAALDEPVNKRAYKSAEELAVERMGDIDNPDMWTTVVEADEEIDIEEILEHLRQRGYKIEEPEYFKTSDSAHFYAEQLREEVYETVFLALAKHSEFDDTAGSVAKGLARLAYSLAFEGLTTGPARYRQEFDKLIKQLPPVDDED